MKITSGTVSSTPGGTIAVTSNTALSSTSNVSVWLVDDNDQFRTLVAQMLGRRGGIECARQFSSPDTLLSALASKSGPDVILLDVQMGDCNGLDAVRPIKSLTPSTRVLMYTTCYDPESRRRALIDGASDYLLKSEPMDKVIARILSPAADHVPDSPPSPSKQVGCEAITPSSKQATGKSTCSLTRTLEILRALWDGWRGQKIG